MTFFCLYVIALYIRDLNCFERKNPIFQLDSTSTVFIYKLRPYDYQPIQYMLDEIYPPYMDS